MTAAPLTGFCVLIKVLFGSSSRPLVMVDATITPDRSKQQSAKLQSVPGAGPAGPGLGQLIPPLSPNSPLGSAPAHKFDP